MTLNSYDEEKEHEYEHGSYIKKRLWLHQAMSTEGIQRDTLNPKCPKPYAHPMETEPGSNSEALNPQP